MRKFSTIVLAAVLAVGLVGCDDFTDLDVENENNPDAEQALTNPSDIEALIGGATAAWWSGQSSWSDTQGRGGDGCFTCMATTMGDEGSVSWGNWAMLDMSKEPRIAWPNSTTYNGAESVAMPWFKTYAAISAASDGAGAIKGGLVIEDAQGVDVSNRALAWAKLMQGIGLGTIAMIFDQGFVITEDTDLTDPTTLPFVSYSEMATAALASLQEAIDLAGANSSLPATPLSWLNQNSLSMDEVGQLAHSFSARILANVARTPAERQAVSWATVISHVDAGITTDFTIEGDGLFGGTWFDSMKWMAESSTWARADYRVVGGVMPNDAETDPDGTYANWLGTVIDSRVEYNLNTADQRIQGNQGVDILADPADINSVLDPGSSYRFVGPAPFRASRGLYHFSMYFNHINELYADCVCGDIAFMVPEEMNLLKAEGLMRQAGGMDPAAAVLIDLTRVGKGGLSSSATLTGDAAWAALYYEKFIEQYFTAAGLAWTERRGAPDIAVSGGATAGQTLLGLVPGTPRHLPVPAKELEVLQQSLYTFGGSGPDMASSADFSGVRVPARAVYAFDPDWTIREKLEYLTALNTSTGLPRYKSVK